MFHFRKKIIDHHIYAPVNGSSIPLHHVKDPVFAEKLMGDGIAFLWNEEMIYAPCNGKIIVIAATKHAIGIKADNGAEVLLHIGLDTVNLHGKGFTPLKKCGDVIKCGEPIMRVDQSFMKEKQMDLTMPMIITNTNDFTLTIASTNEVSSGKSVVITCE